MARFVAGFLVFTFLASDSCQGSLQVVDSSNYPDIKNIIQQEMEALDMPGNVTDIRYVTFQIASGYILRSIYMLQADYEKGNASLSLCYYKRWEPAAVNDREARIACTKPVSYDYGLMPID